MKTATKGRPHMAKQRAAANKVPRKCARCGRILVGGAFSNGMAKVRDGRVSATVGSCCLTLADMAELTIREATTELGINARDQLVYVREVGSESDADWRLAGTPTA